MSENIHDTEEAPTLDSPAERPTVAVRCTRKNCPYHLAQASDADLLMLRLLCRDAAPYLLRACCCICSPCLLSYSFHCGVIFALLTEALEKLTEIPTHMVEHEEWMSLRLRERARKAQDRMQGGRPPCM